MNTKSYMCILRSASSEGCEKPSPSEMDAMYAKYQAWQNKFAESITDMGNKLGTVGSVVRQHGVSDGPFIEIKEIVGGYMMINAASLDDAISIIQESPMIENPKVSIELREITTN